jgi:hypothetical protein
VYFSEYSMFVGGFIAASERASGGGGGGGGGDTLGAV